MSEDIGSSKKEDIDETSDKSDLMKVSGNLISNLPIKMAIIIFFIGMIVFSDLFIDGVLSKFDNSVLGECTTSKGSIIQLLFLVFGFIIMDV